MHHLLKQMGVQVIDENDYDIPVEDIPIDDNRLDDNPIEDNSFDNNSIEKRKKKNSGDGDYSDEWSDYDTW